MEKKENNIQRGIGESMQIVKSMNDLICVDRCDGV